MTPSPALTAALQEAARLPALQALLARLEGGGSNRSTITIYDHADPDDPGATALVTLTLSEAAGVIDEAVLTLTLDAPISQIVDNAGATGRTPITARCFGPAGSFEFDLSVSATGEGGELEIEATDAGPPPTVKLYTGATVTIASAVIQG